MITRHRQDADDRPARDLPVEPARAPDSEPACPLKPAGPCSGYKSAWVPLTARAVEARRLTVGHLVVSGDAPGPTDDDYTSPYLS